MKVPSWKSRDSSMRVMQTFSDGFKFYVYTTDPARKGQPWFNNRGEQFVVLQDSEPWQSGYRCEVSILTKSQDSWVGERFNTVSQGDKPMYIRHDKILYKWDGKDWRGLHDNSAVVLGSVSVPDLQSWGFTFPTQSDVDKYKREHGKPVVHTSNIEVTLRRLEALPLWNEDDLVPSIIKW